MRYFVKPIHRVWFAPPREREKTVKLRSLRRWSARVVAASLRVPRHTPAGDTAESHRVSVLAAIPRREPLGG